MIQPGPRADAPATRVIATVCVAQTLAQLGGFTFAALLPLFFSEWSLTHTEAGWLSGIFFGAYAVSVPVLVTLTDRWPARNIYLFAVCVTALAHVGMAWLADGFWAALGFRILAGVGWAGTYMVGLRALTDELSGASKSRGVAFHAASIGIAGALSFLIAGIVVANLDWEWAFILAGVTAGIALVVAALAFPRRAPPPRDAALFDFRPVFRNRSAMAYTTGYFAHTWEMFVLRSWAVTFLVFAAADADPLVLIVAPTVAAMLMELTGTLTSVVGNEMALRIGRKRWILLVMATSIVLATSVGFTAGLGYGATVIAALIYNAVIYADSASLTAGTVGSADPDRRGATLAMHAMMGYTGGFIGPVVFGVTMDGLGGESVVNWGLSFSHVAVIGLLGPLALILLRPKVIPGEERT